MEIIKTILVVCAAGILWSATARADDSALTAPVKSVYDDYLKIQASLANDSMGGVAENADSIAKAVHADANVLPKEIASEAEVVAKAPDLTAARTAFKPLSSSLIQYLADHHAGDAYVQVYCPMANANWLQADKNVKNPYLGQAMSGCGEIQN
jgi:hypothetical protein